MKADSGTETKTKERQNLRDLLSVWPDLDRLYVKLDRNHLTLPLRQLVWDVIGFNRRGLFIPGINLKPEGDDYREGEVEIPDLHDIHLLLGCQNDIRRGRIESGWDAPTLRNDYQICGDQVYISLNKTCHPECQYAVSIGEIKDAAVMASDIDASPVMQIFMDAKSVVIINE